MSDAILITGGAGYIGSHTAKLIAASGMRPVVVDNLSLGHRDAVKWGPLEVIDLADRAALKDVLNRHQIRAVIHFAARAFVGESMTDPGLYYRNNVGATVNLLDAMVEAGIRDIVFSSTCAVYGIPQRLPLVEDHPREPVSPYGEGKLAVERALRWYGEAHGLRWLALRYFNAAGADPDGELGERHEPETHLIPLTMSAALGQLPALSIFGDDYPTPDGTAVRDYIHITDLADAHLRGLRFLQNGGEAQALNLGTGHGHSVRDVIASVERVSGRKVPIRQAPRRPGDPPELVANGTRAAATLGWRPQFTDLDTIVSHAWRWHTRK